MSDSLVLPAIEWEPISLGLQSSFELSKDNPIGPEFTNIDITRDIDWRLRGAVRGYTEHSIFTKGAPALRAGQMIVPLPEVRATKLLGATMVTMRDVNLGDGSGNLAGDIQRQITFRDARISFSSPEAAISNAKECLIWCLNGPTEDGAFSARTDRSRLFRYERKRAGFPDRVRELNASGFSADALPIPPPQGGVAPCVLARVPAGLPLDYALKPIAIEYALGATPVAPEWPAIDLFLHASSFFLGRRLIPVGLTLFDASARQLLHEIRSAWAVDLRADCARPSMSPVPAAQLSQALQQLVPKFVDRSAQFALSDALWLVWLAESVPMEASLPNLATALEAIMTAWFKSTRTKSGGKYMPDKEWGEASTKGIDTITEKLGTQANADRIIRRVRGANNFGVNERFERFLDELQLPVGAVEFDAIRARNKAAHGGTFTPQQYQVLADQVRAYRSLISRVILKILEWDQQYVDYSTYDFPVRDIGQALGGPSGDGKPAST